MTSNIVEITKTASPIESEGIDYGFSELGNVSYPQGWKNAFEQAEWERVTREEVEDIVGDFDPMDLQHDNTYNASSNIWKDINFGLNELPDGSGRTLLVFKEHGGGDIRGGYSNCKYMIHEESKDNAMYDFHPIAYPEINVRAFDPETNDVLVDAHLHAGGAVDFSKNNLDLVEDDIWEIVFGHDKADHKNFSWNLEEGEPVE